MTTEKMHFLRGLGGVALQTVCVGWGKNAFFARIGGHCPPDCLCGLGETPPGTQRNKKDPSGRQQRLGRGHRDTPPLLIRFGGPPLNEAPPPRHPLNKRSPLNEASSPPPTPFSWKTAQRQPQVTRSPMKHPPSPSARHPLCKLNAPLTAPPPWSPPLNEALPWQSS